MKSKKQLKIIHFSNSYYPMRGGVESVIENLCIELKKKGIKSDVLTLNNSKGKKLLAIESYKGHKIYRVPFINLHYYKPSAIPFSLIDKYDLIHIHSLGYFCDFLLATKNIHKKPIVLSTNGGIFHTSNIKTIKKIYFHTVQKMLLRHADSILAISPQDKETFSKIMPKKKIVLIEPGFSAPEPKGKKKNNTILCVGRLSKNKGLIELIRAFSRTPKKYTLRIVGKDFDSILPLLQKEAKTQGVKERVVFVGEVDNKQLIKEYSKAEYFVSASSYEGFGITAIEAMHYKCKTILNKIPTYTEFASNGKAKIIDFNSKNASEELTLAIKSKFNITKAKKYADSFLWKNKIKEYLEEYNLLFNK